MTYALKAADELAKEGIEAEVIDLRTLRPMDIDTVSIGQEDQPLRHRRGRLAQSGVGAEIAARIMEEAFDYLDAPVARVTGKDVPMPYAATSRSWRCRTSPRWSRRRRPSATADSAIEPRACPSTSSCPRCRPPWRRAISPNG